MGEQFKRLEAEQLKQYYAENFEVFKGINAVKLRLLTQKEKFVIALHDELENVMDTLLKVDDSLQEEIFNSELQAVFEERSILRKEIARKEAELYSPQKSNEAKQIDEYRAQVLEEKLNLIEKQLKDRGIKVKIDNGKVIFKEISQEYA